MRKILLTLVFTIFVIPSAFPEGGGHTVGNGGGLPEIELTKIWSSLENTLKPCLNTLWGCGAYGVHKQKLQKGLEDKASCGTKLKFQVLEGQEPFERGETCKTILVDQKALYSDGKKPISDQALMILAVKMLVTEAYG